MKIENNLPPVNRNSTDRITGAKKNEKSKAENVTGDNAGADNVVFSEDAQVFSKAMMRVIDIPDTRQAIVQSIRSQILDGKYQIHYQGLAKVLASKGILD